MLGFSKQFCIFLLAAAILSPPLTVQAVLKPSEVAVLANSSFDGSVELAGYYCKVRNIPVSHIIALPMPDGELVGRGLYEKSIAVQVRQALEKIPPAENIRCLVSVRGVPLRIAPAKPTDQEQALLSNLRDKRKQALEELQSLLQRASRLAGLPQMPVEEKSTPSQGTRLVKQTLEQVNQARQKIDSLPESLYKQTVSKEFEQVQQSLLGLAGRIDYLGSQGPLESTDPRSAELMDLQNQFRQINLRITELMRPGATAAQLDQAGKLARQATGVLGLVQQLDASMQLINYPYEQSSSSFDSELSMVLAGEYSRGGPVANNLCLDYQPGSVKQTRTLMVSRIDGPTDAIARGLIDMAIQAEADGLKGRAYIDTGWEKAAKGGYKYMEISLLAAAKILQDYSGLPVTLDTKPEVFPEGSCPDAALYCGWYSLKKYVDAFSWVPGAVGYHIASFELTTLRDPKYTGWATSMLRHGITATLGAVDEPILASFPPPDRFFTLLLTGRFSLAECYYMTQRFNSWRLVLIGDPLYNPFAKNPHITVVQAEKMLKQKLP